jgi:hypothetical protein
MTIFEYHSKAEPRMLKIACSGTPHEVRYFHKSKNRQYLLTKTTDRSQARFRSETANIKMHRILRRTFPKIGQKGLE